ncbi:FAD linked oxidase domain protein [Caldalkalibacillus thermarum TA2.A1]|uniref:FAD linked oxidase domain protein n=1 Tax=Caldalkalibacillus thermarum (strain TA2.A1) TaxID=986075 RepID=F5L3W6_CALTT|nr:FAD linked oxidase domain protein [Caldalkalibacillus thermarum TA2.A1]
MRRITADIRSKLIEAAGNNAYFDDEENLTATVETGLNTKALHQAVEAKGLFYPPDPGSMLVSTIGGNIAQCAGGLRGLKYGTAKGW